MPSNSNSLKTIGSSGQISLGKEHAGKHVLIEEVEPGVWLVKVGEFVPDSERWLHTPEARASLDRGLAWAAENPPAASDLDEFERRIEE